MAWSLTKVIDILKFEYVTQLLVDSSYVPLILKLLQLQEVEKLVNFKCEQEELKYVTHWVIFSYTYLWAVSFTFAAPTPALESNQKSLTRRNKMSRIPTMLRLLRYD